jgi:hypothetical protein
MKNSLVEGAHYSGATSLGNRSIAEWFASFCLQKFARAAHRHRVRCPTGVRHYPGLAARRAL